MVQKISSDSSLVPPNSPEHPVAQNTPEFSSDPYGKVEKTFQSNKRFDPIGLNKSKCHTRGCTMFIPQTMQDVVCRCQGIFCAKHKSPSKHHCSFATCTLDSGQLTQQLNMSGNLNNNEGPGNSDHNYEMEFED
jgi:hypothetical protein